MDLPCRGDRPRRHQGVPGVRRRRSDLQTTPTLGEPRLDLADAELELAPCQHVALKVRRPSADVLSMHAASLKLRSERRAMRRRAGRRARDKYKSLRKAWLREHRKTFIALTAGAIVLVVAFHLLMAWYPGNQLWISGFVTGAIAAALFLFRQSPPALIEQWQQGAWGEEFTAGELAKLPASEWTVINDIPRGRYNFDHVVLGPGGLYCLNSKKSFARLRVESATRLRMSNPYEDAVSYTDDRLLVRVKSEAAELSAILRRRTGHRVWVHPVVVWWGPFPGREATHQKFAVVHGNELLSWLERQPRREVPHRAAIAAALQPGRRRKLRHERTGGRRRSGGAREAGAGNASTNRPA